MRREFGAMRQPTQVNNAPHSRFASGQCEVLSGPVLPGFELWTILHGVDQVESCVHPGECFNQRLGLKKVSLHQFDVGSYSPNQRLRVAAQASDRQPVPFQTPEQASPHVPGCSRQQMHPIQLHSGKSTASITWMTPLLARYRL